MKDLQVRTCMVIEDEPVRSERTAEAHRTSDDPASVQNAIRWPAARGLSCMTLCGSGRLRVVCACWLFQSTGCPLEGDSALQMDPHGSPQGRAIAIVGPLLNRMPIASSIVS